jgi:hypothetical protein
MPSTTSSVFGMYWDPKTLYQLTSILESNKDWNKCPVVAQDCLTWRSLEESSSSIYKWLQLCIWNCIGVALLRYTIAWKPLKQSGLLTQAQICHVTKWTEGRIPVFVIPQPSIYWASWTEVCRLLSWWYCRHPVSMNPLLPLNHCRPHESNMEFQTDLTSIKPLYFLSSCSKQVRHPVGWSSREEAFQEWKKERHIPGAGHCPTAVHC